jgi:hypothetical protein
MKLEEFKKEMIELIFDENSETNRGYVSMVDYPEMYPQPQGGYAGGSDGIDFVRLDEGTIAYRINTEEATQGWEISSGLNNEFNFDEFVTSLVDALTS